MKNVITLTLGLFLALYAQAQNKVEGTIVDELGFPVANASVALEGSEEFTHTDFEGRFTLESEKDLYWKVKVASSGYETQSFYIVQEGDAGTLSISVSIDLEELLVQDDTKEKRNTKSTEARSI